MSDFSVNTNSQAHIWEKTNNLRIFRSIIYRIHSIMSEDKLNPIYIDTIQQQWIDRFNGETKWISLEIVKEGPSNNSRGF